MTRRLLTVLFPTVLWLCAAACQSDGDTPSDAVARTDSAGIEVVTNLADPGSLPRRALSLVPELDITRDSEVRLEVREVFRLGSVDGPDEETLFGRVLGVQLDDDGNVYVLDGLAPAVRVFDSDGRYVRSLGGRGAGPGEFMRPNGLIITEDGRLWVRDTGNRRYEVFESDGTFAGSFRRNFRGGLGNLVIDPDGLIWESASTAMDPVTFARELFFVGARPLSGVMESVETVHLA